MTDDKNDPDLPSPKPKTLVATNWPVGYKKPPQSGQFKKGQSGNLSGRPKKNMNFQAALLEALQETVRVKVGGKLKTMTKFEFLVQDEMRRAMAGEKAARQTVVSVINNHSEKLQEETSKIPEMLLLVPPQMTMEEWQAAVAESATRPDGNLTYPPDTVIVDIDGKFLCHHRDLETTKEENKEFPPGTIILDAGDGNGNGNGNGNQGTDEEDT